ncbi:MAG: hypothetical protein CMJ18_17285 [Phycisphaeraceae bacterium]|nr:hypothetical protein [Phycisphaeraceae bacterium]
MTNPNVILDRVCRAVDRLIEASRPYHGLFPSMLDPRTGRMLTEIPDPIEGQRPWDRAYHGSNLIHDEPTLLTMTGLAAALGRRHYAQAVERYLDHFVAHCTNTPSGLFPWGEHSYWDLAEDRIGNSFAVARPDPDVPPIHDHLRQAPLWLWQAIAERDPDRLARFAAGLDWHIKDGEPVEYSRHAFLDASARQGREQPSCDFPRHSGFYIFDLAAAHHLAPEPGQLELLRRFLDYWWTRRESDGVLPVQTHDTDEVAGLAPSQTLSLACSLLEAAPLVESDDPELSVEMNQRAATYIEGFLAAPHDLDAGIFLLLYRRDGTRKPMPIYGSAYGVWPAAYIGLVALLTHRLTGNGALLRWAAAVARSSAATAFPDNVAVPAMDAGLSLGLMADLFDLTGDERYLKDGLALADRAPEACFLPDADLPLGASGIDWYESQMGPGFLLHGLARIALLAKMGPDCPIPADYTAR